MGVVGVLAAMGSAAAPVACDAGQRDVDVPFPGAAPLRVIAVNVATSKTLPADGAIEISFDRLLKPASAVRQSFVLRDAFGANVDPPLVTYEPVTRTLRIASPRPPGVEWLLPDQPYVLALGIPRDGEELGGFRAVDNATLETRAARVFAFTATRATGTRAEPNIAYCTHIEPLLRARCARCHRADDATSGLDLASAAGITASLGRTARVLASQGNANAGTAPGRIFPGDMPILTPGNPAQSFLLYKVLLRPPAPDETSVPPCGGTPYEPRRPGVAYLSDLGPTDREALRDLTPGGVMPPEGHDALTHRERVALSDWIASGAPTRTCACP
jgi:hypothetical protein